MQFLGIQKYKLQKYRTFFNEIQNYRNKKCRSAEI